jgi:hypothetical protein
MACVVLRSCNMKLCILAFTLFSLTTSAQLFTFGVQGGVPAQPPLGHSDNIPFVLGPSVDIRALPWLSVETGVLYHRVGSSTDSFAFLYPGTAFTTVTTLTTGSESSHGSALEVPLLAKFRLPNAHRAWHPFLTAGPTVRRTSITTEGGASSILSGTNLSSIYTTLSPIGTPFFKGSTTQWNVDPAVGVGMDFRTGRFHLEPEVRYSYWGAGTTGPVRKNQVNFLLGFRL